MTCIVFHFVADLGVDALYVLTGERHDNVAQGPIELGVLQRFRQASREERYGVVLLHGALSKQIDVPKDWQS